MSLDWTDGIKRDGVSRKGFRKRKVQESISLPTEQSQDAWCRSDRLLDLEDWAYESPLSSTRKTVEVRFGRDKLSRWSDNDVINFIKALEDLESNGESAYLKIEASRQGAGHCWISLCLQSGEEFALGFGGNGKPWGPGIAWTHRSADVQKWRNEGAVSYSVSVDLKNEGLVRLAEFISSKSGSNYRLLSFNCTTFAQGAFEAATGQRAPGSGRVLGSFLPLQTWKSIRRRNGEMAK